MKRNWIPQTQTMEMISANLRWFIVAVCLFIVYTPSINGFLGYSKAGFTWTALFVVLYTAVDQYVLLRYPVTSGVYKVVTRTSIVMDGVAVLALVAMTGGGHSPFYMVFYLLLLHSAIYWNLAGALYAAGLLTGAYSVMLLRLDPGVFTDPYRLYLYSLQVMFTFVIAFYCGVIASRERKQFKDSNYYRDRLNEDYLTGLFNHRYFQETMDRIYRERQPAYLIMADIDHFKTINDTYGHATGDEVLRQVSGVLSARLRDRNGLAFRYGGEEFAMLVYTREPNEAAQLIKAIQGDVNRLKLAVRGQPVRVTLSFGAVYSGDCPTKNELAEYADKLLYAAKAQGRNRAVFEDGKKEAGPGKAAGQYRAARRPRR